jgi:hypothetical protein
VKVSSYNLGIPDEDEFDVLVMVGGWNKNIFNLEWVSRYLLPNEKLEAEIPLNVDGSPRISSHKGMYSISSVPIGNPDLLSKVQKETIDAVLDFYGNKPSQWLIDLTHMEEPWIKARAGLPDLVRGNRIITLDSMAEYYS